MKMYYIAHRGDLGPQSFILRETRMLTVDRPVLLYLSGSVLLVEMKRISGICRSQAGKGARSNGHEGAYHDGLRSLHDFWTLLHGASADTKKSGCEVAVAILFQASRNA